MASDSLTYSDILSNVLPNQNLEIIHFKVDQSIAILSILSDWISVSPNGPFEGNDRFRMTQAISLLGDLLEDARKLLPEA